jgi:23S rRNA pseudouridine1911/1915/1917 synthase
MIDFNEDERSGVVHRLDKDTSGLIVFARNKKTQESLLESFRNREVVKKYMALVWGRLEPDCGLIDISLARSKKDRKKIDVSGTGRRALTSYRVTKYFDKYSLLDISIKTGRTHQIRVHLASIGFPIVGDRTYGRKTDMIVGRQFLHAYYLEFKLFGEKYSFRSELPQDLSLVLSHLD